MALPLKNFVVVHFTCDNSVEVVPKTWISTDQKRSHWPSHISKDFVNLVQDSSSFPKKDWRLFPVNIVKSYDNYDRGQQKADRYVVHSDTDASEAERPTKLILKTEVDPTTPTFEAPSTSTFEAPSTSTFVAPSTSILRPHKRVSSQSVKLVEKRASRQSNPLPECDLQQPIPPGHPNPPYATTVTPTIPSPPPASQVQDLGYQQFVGFQAAHQPSFANLESHQAPHFGYQTPQNLAPQNYFGYQQPQVELDPLSAQFQLLNEFREFQRVCFENQEKLKTELAESKKLLLTILATSGETFSGQSAVLEKIPISSEEDLSIVEEMLTEETNAIGLRTIFTKIGGRTVSKNVYAILQASFNPSVAKLVRLTNVSGKIAFKDSKLAQIIRDAVHKSPHDTQTTDEEINKYIGRWFRGSTDRHGSRQRPKKCGNSKKNAEQNDSEGSELSFMPNSDTDDPPSMPNYAATPHRNSENKA